MTTTAAPPARRPRVETPPFAVRPAAFAIARIEGPRLIWHPIFLAGTALSALLTLSFAAGDVGGDYFALLGTTLLPLAIATLVVSNLATLRDRRGGTEELYAALAAPAQARTLAHLLAIAWPTAVATTFVAVAFAWLGAWDGLDVTREGRVATPGVADLAQGPLAVAMLGTVGVAVARWIAHPPAAILVSVALFFPQWTFITWNLKQDIGWFLPLVNPARTAGTASYWPCSAEQQSPCILEGFAALHWHVVYVAALAVLIGAGALLRDGHRRRDLVLASACFAIVIAAGVLQLP